MLDTGDSDNEQAAVGMMAALVIGGGSGIGSAAAQRLAQDGARVAVADILEQHAVDVAASLPGQGHFGVAVDVSDPAHVTRLFDVVEQRLGPLRILVLSAGIEGDIGGGRPNFATCNHETWQRILAVNLTGTFLSIQEMLRRRAATPVDDARIVAVSSSNAFTGKGTPAYAASKAGILALVKAASFEAGRVGMTVNAVAPGATDTPLRRAHAQAAGRNDQYLQSIPVGRVARPDEVAAAISFLASPGASYLAGACIDINGGMYMR